MHIIFNIMISKVVFKNENWNITHGFKKFFEICRSLRHLTAKKISILVCIWITMLFRTEFFSPKVLFKEFWTSSFKLFILILDFDLNGMLTPLGGEEIHSKSVCCALESSNITERKNIYVLKYFKNCTLMLIVCKLKALNYFASMFLFKKKLAAGWKYWNKWLISQAYFST